EMYPNIGQPMALHQGGGMLLQQAVDLIRGAGVGQCVVSTDAGQPYSPWPDEELRAFMNCLYDVGLTEHDIRRVMAQNPARLLGLPYGGRVSRRQAPGYWFVAPATLVLVAVLVLPVVHVLYESFVWTTPARARVFPSLRNYEAVAGDEVVRLAATNTAVFTAVSVGGHLL